MNITGTVKEVDTRSDGSQAVTIELDAVTTVNGAPLTIPFPYARTTIQIASDSPLNGQLTVGQSLS